MICAGIDAGSRAIKIVLIDSENRRIVAGGVERQGIDSDLLAMSLYDRMTSEHGFEREMVSRVVATGYARNSIRIADRVVTEITCHAKGVHSVLPEARTVIEIGGQDSKLLILDGEGAVQDFTMNDRCAAGTGRFLEVVAERLGTDLCSLGEMAARSRKPAIISSMCIVFAETEIIGLLASGIPQEDIVAGVQNSTAARVASMLGRSTEPPIAFTGGVAMIPGMKTALEAAIEQPVIVVPDPQMTGALGAALLAASLPT